MAYSGIDPSTIRTSKNRSRERWSLTSAYGTHGSREKFLLSPPHEARCPHELHHSGTNANSSCCADIHRVAWPAAPWPDGQEAEEDPLWRPKEVFESYANGKGFLSFEEFRDLIPFHEDAAGLFELADMDGDEAISFDEFCYLYYGELALRRGLQDCNLYHTFLSYSAAPPVSAYCCAWPEEGSAHRCHSPSSKTQGSSPRRTPYPPKSSVSESLSNGKSRNGGLHRIVLERQRKVKEGLQVSEEELSSLSRLIASLENELSSAHKAKDESDKQLSGIEEAEQARVHEDAKRKQEAEAELEALESRHAAQIAALAAALEKLKAEQEAQRNLCQRRMSEATDKLKDSNSEASALTIERERLEARLKAVQEKLAHTLDQVKDLEVTIPGLCRELQDACKARTDEEQKLDYEIRRLQDELEAQKGMLIRTISESQAHPSTDASNLKEELRKLKQHLREQLDSIEEKRKQALAKIQVLRERIAALNQELSVEIEPDKEVTVTERTYRPDDEGYMEPQALERPCPPCKNMTRGQFLKLCEDAGLVRTDHRAPGKADIDVIFSRCMAEMKPHMRSPFRPSGQAFRKCFRCTHFALSCPKCKRPNTRCTACTACKICSPRGASPMQSSTRFSSNMEFGAARILYFQFLFGLLQVAEKRRTGFAETVKKVLDHSLRGWQSISCACADGSPCFAHSSKGSLKSLSRA